MSTDDSSDTEEGRHAYETDESFHPMGKEWEDEMREELEETDYDADLGMQMAADAQRLVAGEISEEEFYAEYHDDVQEEFETDERPIFDDLDGVDLDDLGDDKSMLQSLKDVDLEADDVSRRSMMKKMGAAGLFLGYSAYATHENGQDNDIPDQVSGVRPANEDEREHRWGMVIDLERCDGCLSCVAGCINENGTSTGANWMYVFAYEDDQSGQENFLVRPCQHCSNAPCAKVCPVRARHTREKDGIVLTNYETCIGCRYCQVACPYGVNYFQWGDPDVEMGRLENLEKKPSAVQSMDAGDGFEARAGTYAEEGSERHEALSEANDHVYDGRGWWVDSRPPTGVMGKCTFCPSRQDEHTDNPKGTVACMNACDETGMSAIHFGDLDAEADEEYGRPARYLEDRTEKSLDGVAKFDSDLEFVVNDDEPIDAGTGYYTLSLVERQPGSSSWSEFASEDVIVSDASVTPSEQFASSMLGGFGSVPSAELDVLYQDDANEIPATVTYGGDFEETSEITATASLQLGGDGETIASQELTFEEGSVSTDLTFDVDGSSIDSEDGVYVLHLIVESSAVDDGVGAAQRGVYLTTGRPNIATPEPGLDSGQRDGSLSDVPEVLYNDETAEINGSIEYPPTGEPEREVGLVLSDGESEDIVALQEFTYTEARTSNTEWDGKISTFKLLEDLGTKPNITYIGNEPGPRDEQIDPSEADGLTGYEDVQGSIQWPVTVKDNRKHHLDYGAGGPPEDHGEEEEA